MKTFGIALCISLSLVSIVYASDFSPSRLTLSAPPVIEYTFDQKDLQIPVEVDGAPANTILLVYTKDEGQSIGTVQNGHLGWHYVNGLDTCVYVSDENLLLDGSNIIIWSGKNDDGDYVADGEYSYYLFAYDNQSPKTLATSVYTIGYSYNNTIVTTDESGTPLAKPIMYMHNNKKWIIGSDPEDTSLSETCAFTGPYYMANSHHVAIDPTDHNLMIHEGGNDNSLYLTKYRWVPNGEAEIITEWGESGHVLLGSIPDAYKVTTGAYTDGETVWSSCAYPFATQGVSEIYAVEINDGILTHTIDLTDWFCSIDDMDNNGQYHGGPDGLYLRNNILFAQSLEGCMTAAINPYAEDEEDYVVWANGNGDYVHDHNFGVDADNPWLCNDFMTGPYTYCISVDANNFNIYPAYDMGAVTFCLISGNDGTGMDYYSIAGETSGWKMTAQFLDEGTAYDGLYMDNNAAENDEAKVGTFYIAHDSISGIIAREVAVTDETPVGFSVTQNTPNPFNPTTTINFSMADAGQVDIDVFNVAGQKVDTLVSENLHAGNHTVTWDASDFSAGVYFYTLKSSGYTRTMKMTLIK